MAKTGIYYFLFIFLISGSIKTTNSTVIQALIDFDDSSENLIGSLISRVDHIVDPVKNDMKNVSLSLAHAILKLAPTLTITGNISDGSEGGTLTFSFSASTVGLVGQQETAPSHSNDDEALGWKEKQGGVLEPLVAVVEPWVVLILEIAAHSILGVILTQVLQATTLLENVPVS